MSKLGSSFEAAARLPELILPTAAPKGWAGALTAGKASRAQGLLKGGIEAWRGTAERGAGTPLTSRQIDNLAEFLARKMRLNVDVVVADLSKTRVQVGGLAHGAGGTATTIGHHVYVSDAARAERILSWPGRVWLTHELTHQMQWRQLGGDDRAFLNHYVAAYTHDNGNLSAGGIYKAMKKMVSDRVADAHGESLATNLHDQHPMEREAARVAAEYRALTTS